MKQYSHQEDYERGYRKGRYDALDEIIIHLKMLKKDK